MANKFRPLSGGSGIKVDRGESHPRPYPWNAIRVLRVGTFSWKEPNAGPASSRRGSLEVHNVIYPTKYLGDGYGLERTDHPALAWLPPATK